MYNQPLYIQPNLQPNYIHGYPPPMQPMMIQPMNQPMQQHIMMQPIQQPVMTQQPIMQTMQQALHQQMMQPSIQQPIIQQPIIQQPMLQQPVYSQPQIQQIYNQRAPNKVIHQPRKNTQNQNHYQRIKIDGENNSLNNSFCKFCNSNTNSSQIKKVGSLTLVWAVLLFVLTGFFCFLPFMMDGCKDTQIICVKCKQRKIKMQATLF